ncbi:MAG: DNA primase [Synergistaceae bacterium]|nr:DNA primase [Synergistaceae bacterium]
MDTVSDITSRLDLVTFVGSYVKLIKRGKNYFCCCPFHNEKTPSLSVSPDKQTWHCFGCGKGGDIITFCMEIEHLDFKEALEKLAELAGVTLERYQKHFTPNKDLLLEAENFFAKQISLVSAKVAQEYLAKRFLSLDDARRFNVGYSPASWDALVRHFAELGISPDVLVSHGLANKNSRGGFYDRFRGRLMFSIRNNVGRIVGFGGRILDGDEAKYVNSPESTLYNKRHILYMLDKAKTSIRERNYCILVEGYMDAIRCHIAGFTNTVASCGTALTQEQAALIKRLTNRCIVCYDSDKAGQEAALRAMYLLQEEGITPRRVIIQSAKDPDELLLEDGGAEKFKLSLKNAMPLPIFHAHLRETDLLDEATKDEALADLVVGLARLSPFDFRSYKDSVSKILGLYSHDLQSMVDRARNSAEKRSDPCAFVTPTGHIDPLKKLESMLLAVIWQEPTLLSKISPDEIMLYVEDQDIQNILFALSDGVTKEKLEEEWLLRGEIRPTQLISAGNGYLALGFEGISLERILHDIKVQNIKLHYDLLNKKAKDGSITDDEYKDLLMYGSILKGRNPRK